MDSTLAERDALSAALSKHLKRAGLGARLWSLSFYGSAFGSMICSVVVAHFQGVSGAKGDVPLTPNLLAILALAAAVLTGLITIGGFERKWQANRTTRAALERLKLLLSARNCDLAAVRDGLADIMTRHENMIQGRPSA
jgi:hypothetical protein